MEWIPEMGYPEYMDSEAPATGGWTTHTVCHATVEVDAHRQAVSVFGDLHAFVETEGVRLMDASCEDTYKYQGIDRYRRTLLLIDLPDESGYVVDVFRVRGGQQHDYLFHGPPVAVDIEGVSLSDPAEGTLAGTDVTFGQVTEGVTPYAPENNDYQYLFNVRQAGWQGRVDARWTVPNQGTFGVNFLSDVGETLLLTDGYPRPSSKSLSPMPFIVRRRIPTVEDPESRFISIFGVNQQIQAEYLPVTGSDSVIALRISCGVWENWVLMTLLPDGHVQVGDVSLRGMIGIWRRRDGQPVWGTLIGGTRMKAEGVKVYFTLPKTTLFKSLETGRE